MKRFKILSIAIFAGLGLANCGEGASTTVNSNETTASLAPVSEEKEKTIKENTDNYFRLNINRQNFQSNKLDKEQCSINYNNNGNGESFIEIRAKDLSEDHLLLINIYLPQKNEEEEGKYSISPVTNRSDAPKKAKRASLIFMKQGQMAPETQMYLEQGDLELRHLDKRSVYLKFKGKGKSLDSQNEQIMDIEGELKLSRVEVLSAVNNQ